MADCQKIRVVVADDHDLVRKGFIALLEQEEDISVVGEACDGLDARNKTSSLSPDIVLMDAKMPVIDGFVATSWITKEFPSVKVLVVTNLGEEYAGRFMSSGASGYVPKSRAAQELRHAIREVYRGRQYCSPSSPGEPVARDKEPCAKGMILTPREQEVLRLLADGHTDQEISTSLGISVRIVEFHEANLIEKTGAKDVAGLARYAAEQHIIHGDHVRE